MCQKVKLSYHEVQHALNIGLARQWVCFKKGWQPKYGSTFAGNWYNHQIGALGELAMAKALGIHWDCDPNVPAVPDIIYKGQKIEVRTVEKAGHRLIVHPKDRADLFALVIIEHLHEAVIAGVIEEERAKQEMYWDDPTGNRPAYFIPSSDLMQLEQLKSLHSVNQIQ